MPGPVNNDSESDGSASSSPVPVDIHSPHPSSEFQSVKDEARNRRVATQDESSIVSEDPTGSRLRLVEAPPPVNISSIKTRKDIVRLNEVLAECSVEAIQAVLRSHWQTFLFGNGERTAVNDAHISFILRTGLANASEDVVEGFLMSASKNAKYAAAVLEQATSDQIDEFVPQDILEPILRDRLRTFPAVQLIRWLAEADRLGYSQDDIMDHNDETVVIPNVQPFHHDEDVPMSNTAHPQSNLSLPRIQTLLPQTASIPPQEGNSHGSEHYLHCPNCNFRCYNQTSYEIHRERRVCEQVAPPGGYKAFCRYCGRGFTTKQGRDGHERQNVCLDGQAPAMTPEEFQHSKTQQMAHPPSRPAPIAQPTTFALSQFAAPVQHSYLPPPTASPNLNERPAIARPPMHTPRQAPIQPASRPMTETPSHGPPAQKNGYYDSPGIRVTPNNLPPEKYAELTRKLDGVDEKYRRDCAATRADLTMSEAARDAKLVSLKNGQASKKSQIRKQYGVTLRLREKDKKAMLAHGLKPAYQKPQRPSNGNITPAGGHYIDPQYGRGSQPQPHPQPQAQTQSTPNSVTRPPPNNGFTPLNRPGSTSNSASSSRIIPYQSTSTPVRPHQEERVSSYTSADTSGIKKHRTDPPNERPQPSPASNPRFPGMAGREEVVISSDDDEDED